MKIFGYSNVLNYFLRNVLAWQTPPETPYVFRQMLLKPNIDKFNEKLFSRSRVLNCTQKNRKCWRYKRKYYTSKTPKTDSINSKNIYITGCAFFMCVILLQLHNIPFQIMWLPWRCYDNETRSLQFCIMPIFISIVIFTLWQLVYCVCIRLPPCFFSSSRTDTFILRRLNCYLWYVC
jgi:hypothetical protein